MRTSQDVSPRIVHGEVLSSVTDTPTPRLPLYDQTVAATGTDPAILFAESAGSCSCNWSGHRVYDL